MAAERARLAPAYVSAIECGAKVPTIETLARLARVYDATLSECLAGVDRPLGREIRSVLAVFAGRAAPEQDAILALMTAALGVADEAESRAKPPIGRIRATRRPGKRAR